MMAPHLVHLPDGQTFTVSPVFAGVGFRSHGHGEHHHPYPVGWTVVLQTDEDGDEGEEEEEEEEKGGREQGRETGGRVDGRRKRPFTHPTRGSDSLFISSVANPPASEFRPAASPTRQLAMLLWVTLYWYFHHEPEPGPSPSRRRSGDAPEHARPVADWRVRVRPDGALGGRDLLAKLERMGLVACSDSAVAAAHGADVFVSRPMFWQLPGRLFLFSPKPVGAPAPSSPPASGPFASTSHLPTYYPPAPLHYVVTHGVRHPLRPRPPRMGDVFYSRFVPSVGQYLGLRVASSSARPVPHPGPVGPAPPDAARAARLAAMSDAALLESWHANPRVSDFWGPFDPDGLARALAAPHSFPVIGLWDGVPFGYFELYWVREDLLGRHVGSDVGDWDRGLHIMIGEEWARGRVAPWLTGLVHWCLTADLRTMSVCLEPRVDNQR